MTVFINGTHKITAHPCIHKDICFNNNQLFVLFTLNRFQWVEDLIILAVHMKLPLDSVLQLSCSGKSLHCDGINKVSRCCPLPKVRFPTLHPLANLVEGEIWKLWEERFMLTQQSCKGSNQTKNSYKAVRLTAWGGRGGHPRPAWPLLFCENFDPFCPL